MGAAGAPGSGPSSASEFGQILDRSVVHEQPSVLLERLGVAVLHSAGGRVVKVGHEDGRLHLLGLLGETPVLVGGDGGLVDTRGPVGVEETRAGPVGIAMTLVTGVVRCVQQQVIPTGPPGQSLS
jgi:hypothetical protein